MVFHSIQFWSSKMVSRLVAVSSSKEAVHLFNDLQTGAQALATRWSFLFFSHLCSLFGLLFRSLKTGVIYKGSEIFCGCNFYLDLFNKQKQQGRLSWGRLIYIFRLPPRCNLSKACPLSSSCLKLQKLSHPQALWTCSFSCLNFFDTCGHQ